MKKKFLFVCMLIAFACLLCIGVMAEGKTTYYLYDDGTALPEGENNISVSQLYAQSDTEKGLFANLKDGDDIVIELKESISYTPTYGTMNNVPNVSNCLRISVAATVTVEFNGYSWWFTHDSAYDAFVVYNEKATLNLIGTKAKNPDGTIKDMGTNYRGSEINENIDIYSDFVVVYVAGGKLHCENLAAFCTEETIYQKNGYLSGKAEVELVDCSLLTNAAGMYTIALAGKENSKNNLRIDGGLYGSICAHNILDDSYIKNAKVKLTATAHGNALFIDSWKGRNAYNFPIENSTIDGRYWGEGDSNIVVGKNSSFGVLYLKGDGSGGAYVELVDSTYTSVDFAGKSGQLTVYTSVSCEKAGTKTVYDNNNTSGVVDESYSAPATGHKLDLNQITDISYDSYLAMGFYKASCTVCGAENIAEKTATAPALFECLGVSVYGTDTYSIAVGFKVNSGAIAEYTRVTGKTLSYGVFAASQEKLGDKDIFDANGKMVDVAIGSEIKTAHSVFEIKVTNIPENKADAKLALGAYVKVTDGETATYSYMQAGTPAANENYYFASYNDALASKN